MSSRQLHELAELILVLAIATGCFWVILAETAPVDNVAAFAILSAIAARLVPRLPQPPSS